MSQTFSEMVSQFMQTYDYVKYDFELPNLELVFYRASGEVFTISEYTSDSQLVADWNTLQEFIDDGGH